MQSELSMAVKLLKTLPKSGNKAISPQCISNCLALLERSAEGETKAQLQKVISLHTSYRLKNIQDVLSVNNALFVNASRKQNVNWDLIHDLCHLGDAEVIFDNFQSVEQINHWVSAHTFGMIPRIIFDISPEEDVVIASIVALQMSWAASYFSSVIGCYQFTRQDGSRIPVPKLEVKHATKHIAVKEGKDFTAISLDFETYGDFASETVILMPKNIEIYLEQMGSRFLSDLSALVPMSEYSEDIRLILPRFKTNCNVDLKAYLRSLGVTDLFNVQNSDLSRLLNEGGYVSTLLHSCYFDFNDQGVRAAAGTFAILRAFSMEPEKRAIIIDRPFIFGVREKETDHFLFLGVITEPEH